MQLITTKSKYMYLLLKSACQIDVTKGKMRVLAIVWQPVSLIISWEDIPVVLCMDMDYGCSYSYLWLCLFFCWLLHILNIMMSTTVVSLALSWTHPIGFKDFEVLCNKAQFCSWFYNRVHSLSLGGGTVNGCYRAQRSRPLVQDA